MWPSISLAFQPNDLNLFTKEYNSETIRKIQKKEKVFDDAQLEPLEKTIEINKENIVTSPMVGVIYLSSDPSNPPFVKEGQHVKQGDVLLLIEAMKTFNEIKAPKSGVIKKIIVLNNQPVEFGETLLIFE